MAKKKGIRAGASYKVQYAAYKAASKCSNNRKRDLERHVKRHPEDKVAISRLKKGMFSYTRNRKSNGHKVKEDKLYSELLWNRMGHLPKSFGEVYIEAKRNQREVG